MGTEEHRSHRHRNQDQDMRIRMADMPEPRHVPRMTVAEAVITTATAASSPA
jgi:hypothetical protein